MTFLRQFFDKLSISGKSNVLFGILAGVSVLISVSALVGFASVYQSAKAYESASRRALTGSHLTATVAKAESGAKHYLASGDAMELDGATRNLSEARAALAKLREDIKPEETAISARLNGLDQAVTNMGDRISGLTGGNARPDKQKAAVELDRLTFAGNDFFNQSRTLNQEIGDGLDYTGESLMLGLTSVIGIIVTLGLCGICIAVFAARFAHSNISAPVMRITGAMRKIVQSDADLSIPEADRSDEIGEMAKALGVFKENSEKLHRLQSDAAEAAKAELDALAEQQGIQRQMREEHAAQLAQLADRFEQTIAGIVGGVASASTQLQQTASSMASAAEQSASQTGHFSTSLGEVSHEATSAAATTDEFAMSINEISRQASASAELARKASSSAVDADGTITTLTRSVEETGKIVQLIASIAQRTNLLALNASIEAARGGDAGRGFAVVASEVKDLAIQTARATDDVAHKIRAIQDSAEASIGALRSIATQIDQLETASVAIASAVDQQSVAGQDLARSIDLTARNTNDVLDRIVDIRAMSEATGTAANEVLISSNELERQSSSLKLQVDEFLGQVRAA